MASLSALRSAYPWVKTPLIACAPMLRIATAPLAVAVSRAGGLGFLAAGFDLSDLEANLKHSAELLAKIDPPIDQRDKKDVLPIGVGFINWGADLTTAVAAIKRYTPCAVWFFAPASLPGDLIPWAEAIRSATNNRTKIWVQVGSVSEAVSAVESFQPDVLVIQGSDAGGHGLARSASVMALLPEVKDTLRERNQGHIPLVAAGGITDGRGLAASLALGASGVVMGTRFLASKEANISHGYQMELLRASDGGISTVRTKIYDKVRGFTSWPERYNGRGVINRTYVDAVEKGTPDEENRRLYEEEVKKGDAGWGPDGRMTTYAGTGVGLLKDILPAGEIVRNTRLEAERTTKNLAAEQYDN
ncbi:hypothetical protein DTO166G4_8744 [Paecilomyces variotii]|nr:hypothetical protein DTO166G4_8744 [Paecilomyces variotii]KAJ9228326.1 hypothetical protein DTO166G5_8658 [Paecilomyces variotii]KAJ9264469.1 hypothetical protein DTO195F2_2286 [Paecilomyces variotii]KAJ9358883.1 hypothetical protein DTO027B9_2178 [Paecilomyces variotii]KAJ9370400.1 hypothetical protein DTO282E5_4941 [Paecilomyces variotii]